MTIGGNIIWGKNLKRIKIPLIRTRHCNDHRKYRWYLIIEKDKRLNFHGWKIALFWGNTMVHI